MTIEFWWRQIFEILMIHKPSLESLDVPQKIWARSVQPFWRILDTNKQTDRQTDRQAKFIYRFSKIMFSCAVQKAFKTHFIKKSAMHVFTVLLCVFIPICQLCWKLWFHFKSLMFEKFNVIWLNIVTKGFLFQNSAYKKCNVVELNR